MSCCVNGQDLGVSAPYFCWAQVLVDVIDVQAPRLVTLLGKPALLQAFTVCTAAAAAVAAAVGAQACRAQGSTLSHCVTIGL